MFSVFIYVVAEWEGAEVGGVYYVQCVYFMWSQSGKVRRWEVFTMFSVFIYVVAEWEGTEVGGDEMQVDTKSTRFGSVKGRVCRARRV
jgi:hypothetical protein